MTDRQRQHTPRQRQGRTRPDAGNAQPSSRTSAQTRTPRQPQRQRPASPQRRSAAEPRPPREQPRQRQAASPRKSASGAPQQRRNSAPEATRAQRDVAANPARTHRPTSNRSNQPSNPVAPSRNNQPGNPAYTNRNRRVAPAHSQQERRTPPRNGRQSPGHAAHAHSRYNATYARPARSLPEQLQRITIGPFNGLHLAIVFAILVLALVAATVIGGLFKPAAQPETNTNNATQNTTPALEEQMAAANDKPGTELQTLLMSISVADLAEIMDIDDVTTLVHNAQNNQDLAWIAANYDLYAWDGEAVQTKLLKLAANDPLATGYVRNWPEKYPSDAEESASYPASSGSTSDVPLLFQWDQRWGYTIYSSASFGLTGCCPTSFCMAYQGLTGNTDLSPADFGAMAERDGYMDQYRGTNSQWLVADAGKVGLRCYQIGIDSYALTAALQNGSVVVCNVGPGDFTDDGHFIVLTGLDENGDLLVNDPYSSVRSSQTWRISTVLSQTRALFAFYTA